GRAAHGVDAAKGRTSAQDVRVGEVDRSLAEAELPDRPRSARVDRIRGARRAGIETPVRDGATQALLRAPARSGVLRDLARAREDPAPERQRRVAAALEVEDDEDVAGLARRRDVVPATAGVRDQVAGVLVELEPGVHGRRGV